MFSEHFPGGEAHDTATDSREHAELEAGEGDGGGAQAGGHEEGGGDGHLTVVCLQVISSMKRYVSTKYIIANLSTICTV